jgi:hypothetical protein
MLKFSRNIFLKAIFLGKESEATFGIFGNILFVEN